MADGLQKATYNILAECRECGLCSDSCYFLLESNNPAAMARRGFTREDAYGCSLCARCLAVCPLGLSPFAMFQARRAEAVQRQELDPEEFNYFMPDCEKT
jgi:Fe-S oxidoreductase